MHHSILLVSTDTKCTNTSVLLHLFSLLVSNSTSTSTSRMFVNKTFGLTKDVPTTKAHATRIAQPVFIFAISKGGRCLLFTNVEIIPVRCAVGSRVPLSDAQRILSRSVSRPTAGGQALFSSAPRLRWRRHNRYNSSYRSVLLKDTH